MWTKDQMAKWRRSLAAADQHSATIDKLAQLAVHSPGLKDVVAELQARRDNLEALSKTALALADPTG